jgi:hypothetical protein
VFHHSSATVAATMPATTAAIATTHTLKLPALTILMARFLSLFPLPDPPAVEDLRDQRAEIDETHVRLVVF